MSNLISWLIVMASLVWMSVASMTLSILTRALALRVLWGWFVVPIFGVSAISMPAAAGLITMTYLLVPSRNTPQVPANKSSKEDEKDDGKTLSQSLRDFGRLMLFELLVPVTAVAVGWLFKQAMGV